jgi:hypothetical protein
MAVLLVAALVWCAPRLAPAEDGHAAPLISAERLGDADAAEPGADANNHYLSPAEREALAAQGYDLQIDDTIVTQTRIQPSQAETEPVEPKGAFGRAMDSVGKGMVAVASVALPLTQTLPEDESVFRPPPAAELSSGSSGSRRPVTAEMKLKMVQEIGRFLGRALHSDEAWRRLVEYLLQIFTAADRAMGSRARRSRA